MRELPRQLDADELSELFGGRTSLVDRLAGLPDPLVAASTVVHELTEDDQIEALSAHPAIGASGLTGNPAREQGSEDDSAVLTELGELNRAYEEKFGFRFVVFVNRRARSEIVPVLRARLRRSREDELETGLDELVAIARDRWEGG